MRIIAVIGTRPEAIKMLPLVAEARKHKELEMLVCNSGQHGRILDEVFEFFNIKPDFTFNAMKNGQSLNELTNRLLNYFDVLFDSEKVDIVLVHGDTTTAFCAALSAFYKGIRVGHIEAGLRTHNNRSPFPEEFNRVAIDAVSDLLFAPTSLAREELEKEGRLSVFTVGNTVIDALKYTVNESYASPLLSFAKDKKILLVTTHRRENLGDRMESSLLAVRDILDSRDDFVAILPMHPNPTVHDTVERVFKNVKKIKMCEPLSLYDFHNILARSFAVFTDSGGVQEEAAYLGIPVFLLRDTTERREGEQSGNIMLVGNRRGSIVKAFENVMGDSNALEKMQRRSLVFGDGSASKKIVKNLLSLT